MGRFANRPYSTLASEGGNNQPCPSGKRNRARAPRPYIFDRQVLCSNIYAAFVNGVGAQGLKYATAAFANYALGIGSTSSTTTLHFCKII